VRTRGTIGRLLGALGLAALAAGLQGCTFFDPVGVPRDKLDSVFRVVSVKGGKVDRTGAGFLIADRIIATSRSVVEGSDKVYVGFLTNGRPSYALAIIKSKSDDAKDVALLEAVQSVAGTPLQVRDGRPAINLDVRALGFSETGGREIRSGMTENDLVNTLLGRMQLYPAVEQAGHISSVIVGRGNVDVIQHGASINDQNSGGPLVDACGVVLGVNSLKVKREGTNSSVATSELVALMRQGGIQVTTNSDSCVPDTAERNVRLALGAAALLLSVGAMLFALRKPQVRERLSQMILPDRSPAAPRRTAPQKPAPQPSVAQPKSAPQPQHRPAPPAQAQAPRPVENGSNLIMVSPQHAAPLILVPIEGGTPILFTAQQLQAGVVVGRHKSCDVMLRSDTVSKRHARFQIEGAADQLFVQDLGSSNGTWRGKTRLQRAGRTELIDGDTIRFGAAGYRVEYQRPGATPPSPGPSAALGPTVPRKDQTSWFFSGLSQSGRVMQFTIVPKYDPQTGKDVETVWTVGRKPEQADLVLLDDTVSLLHAKIRFTPGQGLRVCDLNSSNGTQVNGKPIGGEFVSLDGIQNLQFGSLKMAIIKN